MKYEFPEKLKELRLEKGLSTRKLAEELNNKVTKTAICLWEEGKRVPSLQAVMLIAEYFGVSLDFFAGADY